MVVLRSFLGLRRVALQQTEHLAYRGGLGRTRRVGWNSADSGRIQAAGVRSRHLERPAVSVVEGEDLVEESNMEPI